MRYFFSLEEETLNNLRQMFDKDDLINYLPNENLKRTHSDASKAITSIDLSIEAKMGIIRPLIEAFLNYENKVEEDNRTREAIKTFVKNNEGGELPESLFSALHKILDETLKGVHIKTEQFKNDPSYILALLETLFTKLYVMPIEEEKLKKDIEDRRIEIDQLLQIRLQNLK